MVKEQLDLLATITEQVKQGQITSLAIIAASTMSGYTMACAGEMGAIVLGCEKMKIDIITNLFRNDPKGNIVAAEGYRQ